MGGSSVAAAPAAAAEAWVGSIPRKPKIPASGGDPNRRAPSQESQEVASRRVQIVSERPFVLRIQTAGMRLPLPSPTPKRNKSRIYIKNNNKRSRPEDTRPDSPLASSTKKSARQSSSGGVRRTYEELEDTDNSEDFLTPAEELDLLNKRNRRKPKKPRTADGTATADPKNATAAAAAALPSGDAATTMTLTSESLDPSSALLLPTGGIIPTIIEPPPSGVLSTLWYSKECYLHIFVMEKICGWKTRPIVQLVVAANDNNTLPDIINNNGGTSGVVDSLDDVASAAQLQQEVLAMSEFRNNVKKRMEISRINPCQCPIVMSAAATPSTNTFTQSPLFRVDGKTTTTNNKYSFYKHSPASSGTKAAAIPTREEVLLVKWRGRSHMHCSWERAADIERLDPSTNNSAKNKVRKFYQTQEIRYGLDWKKLLEDELNTAASIQTHGNNNGSSSAVVGVDGGANSMSPAPAANDVADVSDEYFSPQCLEVERILACDENETDMTVFAKQRSLNMSEEFEELSKKEEQQQPLHDCGTFNMNDRAEIWDSEDGVRYVVKWKGLPYVDMTWEYWWDIKRSAVDEVEDFWYRQQAPDVEMMRLAANRPHPQMKDFKKLQESPSYGVSKKPRPHLGGDNVVGDGVNESDPGFRLRSYQLEGLNWLLFNWWNRRSCILADEMGLG